MSRISAPTEAPNVVETWMGGLPEMIFRCIVLSLALETTRTPFVFPPMVFLSIRLPLLSPTRPTPKELLSALFVGVTEPLPL